jgi:hypothetical protein
MDMVIYVFVMNVAQMQEEQGILISYHCKDIMV